MIRRGPRRHAYLLGAPTYGGPTALVVVDVNTMDNKKNAMLAGLLALIVAPTVGAFQLPDVDGSLLEANAAGASAHTVSVTCTTTSATADANGDGASTSAGVTDETSSSSSGGSDPDWAHSEAEGNGPGSSASASTSKLQAKCKVQGGDKDCASADRPQAFRLAVGDGLVGARTVQGRIGFSPELGDFVLVGEMTSVFGTEPVTLGAVNGVFSADSARVELGNVDLSCAPLAYYFIGPAGVDFPA